MKHKNHVSLIGTVGKDAEVRSTQGGVQYARFSLATSSGGYQKRDGSQVPEKTEWHSITAWRELADFCGKYVKKGMKVDVEGMITYGQYQDQQGQTRQSVEIMASDIVLMSMPQNQQGQQQRQPQNQPQGGGYQPQPQGGYQQGGGYQQRPPQNQYQGQQQQPQVQYGGGSPFPPPQTNTPGADDLPF